MPHETTTTQDAWTAFPARPAGQSDRDRHGFAKALTTDAGRAWLKLHDERKDRALSVVSPQHAITGRWPGGLVVPEAAADDVARAAVHGDAGLGQSLLGLVSAARLDTPVFGLGAAVLRAAGCPEALAVATAEWGLALTHAGTAVCRAERKPRGRRTEVDAMIAARGRAHADLLLSRPCFPAIAAAAWCSPVELGELWYFTTDALGIKRWRLDELTREAVGWAHQTFTRPKTAAPPSVGFG
jgi:hypothetical protein